MLGYRTDDYVRRLLLAGILRGSKDSGRWLVEVESVLAYKSRVEHKRSSKSNAQAARDSRRADARARFAPSEPGADLLRRYGGASS